MNVEDLPSLVAWPCARGAPLESPPASAGKLAVRAYVELATIRMLAETLRRPEAVPFTVESAMRLSMLEPMDLEAWTDLYAALEHCGLVELLGLPGDPPAAVRAAVAEVGADDVLGWLEHANEADAPGPATAEAVAALCRAAHGLTATPPWHVRAVREAAGGFEVDARRLVGTGWPAVRRVACASRPTVEPGSIVFWDGQSPALPVPSWLLQWDEDRGLPRVYAGRDPKSGRWLYAARHPFAEGADQAHLPDGIPDGIPPFLAEPTWATPAPGEPRLDPNAQTAALLRPDPHRATTAMTSPRSALPPVVAADEPPPPGARLVLRVVVGPDLLRWVALEPDAPITLGRNQGASSFALHHHQVSRAHTEVRLLPSAAPGSQPGMGEVRVRDLGSTNGTQVHGRTLAGHEEGRLHPGELVGVGPVLLRLEWLGPEREARIARIADLRGDESRRDPLTLLLRPNHLIDELPERLSPSFREGGTAPDDAPSLWGVLLYVDRLAAIHAQHGEKVADRVFRDLARVLQHEVDHPERGVRVGFGEVLLPLVGVSGHLARLEAERLVAVVAAHPWEPPIERLSVTASIAQKPPSEPAADWLRRMRRQLQDGRTRQGRGRVYPQP